jgi:hypothetical protein
MSGQESPTPLSATSNSLPISPTHRSLVGDAGISEHGDTSRYGNQMTPISPSRDTASEVQHGSSPPSPSPVPAVVHTRRSIPNDPYSKLTSLQRDVILCLKSAEAEVPNTSSLYPTSERNPIWRGVHLSTIVNSVRRPGRRPVEFEEFELVTLHFMNYLKGLIITLENVSWGWWKGNIFSARSTTNIIGALALRSCKYV